MAEGSLREQLKAGLDPDRFRIEVFEPGTHRLIAEPPTVALCVATVGYLSLIALVAVLAVDSSSPAAAYLLALVGCLPLLPLVVGGVTRERRRVSGTPSSTSTQGTPIPGRRWQYQGHVISHTAATELDDARNRFEHAARLLAVLDRPPVTMADVRPAVDALLYEAAGHPWRVTEIDRDLDTFGMAKAGSAAAVHADDLRRRRADHQAAVHEVNREADRFMREVGELVASTKLGVDHRDDHLVGPTAPA